MTDTSHPQETNRKAAWLRGLFMLLVAILMRLASVVISVVALIQFVWILVKDERNEGLTSFGRSMGKWFSQAIAFQTVNTEQKPFPWAEWPSED